MNQVLPGSVYQELPRGAGMRVAIRRTLRVGRRAGTPVEDLGVVPARRHYLTRSDLLNGNEDLINAAGSLLAEAGPVRGLTVDVQSTSPTQATVTATTQGMTRLDVYLDDRPVQSSDVEGRQTTFTIPTSGTTGQTLEIRGYDGNPLVARYRTAL